MELSKFTLTPMKAHEEIDEVKIRRIYFWMQDGERYKNGVTNNEVLKHFGIAFSDAWRKLKARKKVMFFENGKWFRWS